MDDKAAPNDEAELERISEDIRERINRVKTASWASLQNHRDVGQRLAEAKLLLKGKYLKWAKGTHDFNRSWCAALIQLDASWPDVEAAEQANIFSQKDYSVQAALRAVRQWKAESTPPESQQKKSPRKTASEVKAELEQTLHKLAIVEAELTATKAENENLKAQLWAQAETDRGEKNGKSDVQSTGHEPDTSTSRGKRQKLVTSMSGDRLTPVTDPPLDSRGVEQDEKSSTGRAKSSRGASALDEAARDGSVITPELAKA